ncbi:unnamed protein product [Symbiodinium necroappetens]|uniref:Uncharacterized protein n=1 Tax=Symbiodinium necroappetens TaxID=1628268 RepID=A0A812PW01_9DINO|nr:unnamed protein product [Symbiodinium necroappetens]
MSSFPAVVGEGGTSVTGGSPDVQAEIVQTIEAQAGSHCPAAHGVRRSCHGIECVNMDAMCLFMLQQCGAGAGDTEAQRMQRGAPWRLGELHVGCARTKISVALPRPARGPRRCFHSGHLWRVLLAA